jgi:tRNA(Ile)-lysidine synthase
MTFPTFTAALDRRLAADATTPLAVGFSGGGDSLALLILTLEWARAHGRRVVSLTVDHQLNPASAGWTADAVAKAAGLGATARALAWTGDKPRAGLPAAARAARHALLAEAARAAGARVLLLGHTRDDLAEAAAMRAEGSTVSDPRGWAPSPAWPQGRGLFVLRPLLEVGRAEIRDWLTRRGETWLEDPANEDPKYARARARKSLLSTSPPSSLSSRAERSADLGPRGGAHGPWVPDSLCEASGMTTEDIGAEFGKAAGYLTLPRTAPAAHLAAACLCAAGTTQPPRGERLRRLVDRIRAGETFTATLAGARVEAAGNTVSFYREPGETRRSSPPRMGEAPAKPTEGGGDLTRQVSPTGPADRLPHEGRALEPSETLVWDGRYEITAGQPGLAVRPLQGLASRLPFVQRQALKGFPAAARPALPAIVSPDGTVTCPILAGSDLARARCLVADRFEAAIGLIDQEAAT